MNQKPKRLDALLDLRTRAVEAAERAAASRIRATLEARAVLHDAEARYEAALVEATKESTESAWDRGYRRAHLGTLRVQVTRAQSALSDAMKHEEHARAALVDAKREHKKLELWCESRARDARTEDDRRERLATDELALLGMRKA